MAETSEKLKNIGKIAVLRANELGDFIVTLPALHALRNTYPAAEIVLLGKQWHKQFLIPGRSPVDRVIVVPVKDGICSEGGKVEDKAEVDSFIAKTQAEKFDVIINFQGSGVAANPFIKKFGAKLTVGLTSAESEKLDRSINYYYYQSETIRFLEVVKSIGATTTDLEPAINVLPPDLDEINEFSFADLKKPYVILHPMAMDVRRMWPIENYAAVADELKARGFEVIFTGSKEDKRAINTIISNMSSTAINACGLFGLGGLAALLSKAAFMIGADTGPLHLARAVNTPTIGFYWAPNLINWGPVTRSIHRPLVSWKMECPICGVVPNDPYPFEPQTKNCQHLVSFVRDISVQQVFEAIDEIEPRPGNSSSKQNASPQLKEALLAE